MKDQDALRFLEDLIDSRGLEYVLDCLAVICFEKADHVASNWQDPALEKRWTKAGTRLSAVAAAEVIRDVSPRI